MKKLFALIVVAAVLFAAPAAVASKKPKPKPQQQPAGMTLTPEQFLMILEMLARQPQAPQVVPSQPGKPGEAGKPGEPGERGPAGEQGRPGASGADGRDGVGADGLPGADGRDGRDGVGFSPGVLFLVNGACPEGTSRQGEPNRWTVYANDTSGRPWTTSGSSAQLFLSACQVS